MLESESINLTAVFRYQFIQDYSTYFIDLV